MNIHVSPAIKFYLPTVKQPPFKKYLIFPQVLCGFYWWFWTLKAAFTRIWHRFSWPKALKTRKAYREMIQYGIKGRFKGGKGRVGLGGEHQGFRNHSSLPLYRD